MNAEFELRLFVSRFCLCCFSFQAFWGNVPQGGNPEFKVSYLFPPSISSNTIKQDFVLLLSVLTFAELDHVVCKLAYRFKRSYPFANIFCLKNVHHLCKTRLLKIRKNAFEFQTKIQKHSAMVRGAVKKTDILQSGWPYCQLFNKTVFWSENTILCPF